MKVSVRPEDLLFGIIPGVQLYAQFTRAFLSFYNASEDGTSLSFMPLNNFSDPLPLYRVDRVTIMAIHIGSKGNGARKHADLGRHPKEFDLSNLTAVGQNTSSDAVN